MANYCRFIYICHNCSLVCHTNSVRFRILRFSGAFMNSELLCRHAGTLNAEAQATLKANVLATIKRCNVHLIFMRVSAICVVDRVAFLTLRASFVVKALQARRRETAFTPSALITELASAQKCNQSHCCSPRNCTFKNTIGIIHVAKIAKSVPKNWWRLVMPNE